MNDTKRVVYVARTIPFRYVRILTLPRGFEIALTWPAPSSSKDGCGSFGCVLPKGHNIGRADVPSNHRTHR